MTTNRTPISRRAVLAGGLGVGAAALLPAAARAAEPVDLILGDSYVYGYGATKPTNGWAHLVGPRLGWNTQVEGVGGDGYCRPINGVVYADRLWSRAMPAQPRRVVLYGSSNDHTYTKAQIAGGVNQALRVVRRRWGAVPLTVVGPTNPYGNVSGYWVIDDVLRRYAALNGASYISPMTEGWFVPGDGKWAANTDSTSSGYGHPNDAGYAHMADRFVADADAIQ